jgi:hypothetical protein
VTAFCEIEKIPITCDRYAPACEERDDDKVKVLRLTLRFALNPALADTIDVVIAETLYKDGHHGLTAVAFALTVPRQQLLLFATPDSPRPLIAFHQVAITKVRAELDEQDWELICTATFGPCGPHELAAVHDWYAAQRFVTFSDAQATLALGNVPATTLMTDHRRGRVQ